MIKQELIEMVEKANENITEANLKYNINEEDEIIHIFWNPTEEFECIYSGDKTLFRWLKVGGYMDYCRTPRVVKDFYKKLIEELS